MSKVTPQTCACLSTVTLSDNGGVGFPRACGGPCGMAKLSEVGAEWGDLERAVLELLLLIGQGWDDSPLCIWDMPFLASKII